MKEFFQLIRGFIPWILLMFIAEYSLFQPCSTREDDRERKSVPQ